MLCGNSPLLYHQRDEPAMSDDIKSGPGYKEIGFYLRYLRQADEQRIRSSYFFTSINILLITVVAAIFIFLIGHNQRDVTIPVTIAILTLCFMGVYLSIYWYFEQDRM